MVVVLKCSNLVQPAVTLKSTWTFWDNILGFGTDLKHFGQKLQYFDSKLGCIIRPKPLGFLVEDPNEFVQIVKLVHKINENKNVARQKIL